MKNKKHGLPGTLVLLLVFGFIANGCVSSGNTYVYDKTAPEENLSQLDVGGDFAVSTFDGQEVRWAAWDTVKIPAGIHTLVVGYSAEHYFGGSLYRVSANDLEVTGDFQPGRRYSLIGTDIRNDEAGGRTVIASIWQSGFMREFTPSSDPTKFEGKWQGADGDNDYFVFTGGEYEFGGTDKGFFEFTDTNLIFDKKWERKNINARWTETPEKQFLFGFGTTTNITVSTRLYEFDIDGNLVFEVGQNKFVDGQIVFASLKKTYRKVDR
jgi:hypothetical protein